MPIIKIPPLQYELWSRSDDHLATVELCLLGSTVHKTDLAVSIDFLATCQVQVRAFDEGDESILVRPCSPNGSSGSAGKLVESAAAYDFFHKGLISAAASNEKKLLRFMVPLWEGSITRSDIIPIRFQDCSLVYDVVSFARPLQRYPKLVKGTLVSVAVIIERATAGLFAHPNSSTDLDTLRKELDKECDNRLNMPWMIPEVAVEKRLALVTTNGAFLEYEAIGMSRAVAATGTRLVVLDTSGTMAEKDKARFEAVLPLSVTDPKSESLATEIVATLKAYGKPIDGIITIADDYWPAAAAAGRALGLSMPTPEALLTATNKYRTSVYVGNEAYHATTLGQALDLPQKHELPYPAIVKPVGGWSSEGVYLVNTGDEFEKAVKTISASRHGAEVVVEPYCDGPEFDINFVLQDGEVLFEEFCDDLPKTADTNGPIEGNLCSFHELYGIYPSILPATEQQLIHDRFLEVLLSLGLRDGVFHLEGRMVHSSVEYVVEDGVPELAERKAAAVGMPKPWLLEINVRPPGMTSSRLMEATYGVDYWGLAVLSAVGDKARVRALSQPFEAGPQYVSIMVFIPADFSAECQGIFDSDDVCEDLMTRRPDLRQSISSSNCLLKRGTKIPHPSTGHNTFVAVFNIFSRKGRAHARAIAQEVRDAVRYSFV